MINHEEMSERKLKILHAIIQNYLETGEPVGSRTISKYTDLNLSSATIRNEMADLEDLVCRLNEDILKAATDFVRLNELSKQKEEASAKLEEKMERWMYLEEKAARIEAGELEENTENE